MANQSSFGLSSDASLSPYKTIGGKGRKIVRHPSDLKHINDVIPERSLSSTGNSPSPSDEWSRPSSVNAVSRFNETILKWDESEVIAWLREIGFAEYEVMVIKLHPHVLVCALCLNIVSTIITAKFQGTFDSQWESASHFGGDPPERDGCGQSGPSSGDH